MHFTCITNTQIKEIGLFDKNIKTRFSELLRLFQKKYKIIGEK
jgi:hypothetical protein